MARIVRTRPANPVSLHSLWLMRGELHVVLLLLLLLLRVHLVLLEMHLLLLRDRKGNSRHLRTLHHGALLHVMHVLLLLWLDVHDVDGNVRNALRHVLLLLHRHALVLSAL